MAVVGSHIREDGRMPEERHLLHGEIISGCIAFGISRGKGLDRLVLISHGQFIRFRIKIGLPGLPDRHGHAARIHIDKSPARLRDLFETLRARLDLLVGPSITHRIASGIHQINDHIVVIGRDLARGLRILDRIGIQRARKRYLEIGLGAIDGHTVPFGILAAGCQQGRRGQNTKTFIDCFHKSFNKPRERGNLPRGNSTKLKTRG